MAEEMQTEERLDALFRRMYRTELASNDAFVQSLWHRVRPSLQMSFETVGISNLGRSKGGDLRRVCAVLDDDVPNLRRQAAPLASRVGYNEEGGEGAEGAAPSGSSNKADRGLWS